MKNVPPLPLTLNSDPGLILSLIAFSDEVADLTVLMLWASSDRAVSVDPDAMVAATLSGADGL